MPRQNRIDLDAFNKGMDALPGVLKLMGYDSLRQGQEEPITRLMMGHDVLAILPTGGGKTAIYASVTKAQEHKTVVFSPLVALMQDQVQSLNRKGIRAAAVNSSQSEVLNTSALQSWGEEKLDVLLVAPERMDNPQFIAAMDMCPPSFVGVDEAHTVSQWAAVFRPAYTKIGDFVDKYNPKIILALTATATTQIVEDIKRIVRIENGILCKHLPPRLNLKLHSEFVEDSELLSAAYRRVKGIKGSCIVYCPTVNMVTSATKFLADMGESVTFYHGQMTSASDKAINQEEFMSGRKRIMVATNAFGMGIDKADIRGIIHLSPPGSVEAISQEVGRAARDGGEAHCWMFNTPSGTRIQNHLFASSNPKGWEVEKMYKYLETKQDKFGDIRMTVDAMKKDLNMEAAQGALNILTNAGCISRFKDDADVRVFMINPDAPEQTGTPKAILDGIKEGGIKKGKSAAGWDIWEVDYAYVIRATGKVASTVTSNVNKMVKANVLQSPPRFTGKITHLEKAPTKEDINNADIRWKAEKKKFDDVLTYLELSDDKKQEFLVHYFDLDSDIA